MKNQKGVVKVVKLWLILGLVMIFFQILLGGITRLTGSGLSITKWDIITGSIPPLTEKSWNAEFELYKVTPQYQHINQGMSLEDFKFIYFWEFTHRLWARAMGFVFLLPLIFFIYKRYINKELAKQLVNVFLLAVIVASAGWIMVASGLINRPWVNAYKLSIHLILAVILFCYLLWIVIGVYFKDVVFNNSFKLYSQHVLILVLLIFVQIFLGGMMSGMKAGLMYPTWPEIGNEYIPKILLDRNQWQQSNFVFYDKNIFMPTLIQLIHRTVAYVIFFYALYVISQVLKNTEDKLITMMSYMLISLLILQIVLGILTVLNCVGRIPLLLGVLHQGTGILLLGNSIVIYYFSKRMHLKNVNNSVS